MKHRVISWDWKQTLDIEELNKALQEIFDGTQVPHVADIATESDEYAIVITSEPVTTQTAHDLYWTWVQDN